MAKQPPSKPAHWDPSAPLRFADAKQDKLAPNPLVNRHLHPDDARRQEPGSPHRTTTPTNHRQFNRQKKG